MTDVVLPSPVPDVGDLRATDRLTGPQRRFLEHFQATVFKRRFYLSGGAALSAGYLGHRYSDDLDFFGPDPVPIRKLVAFMEQLPGLHSLQWLLPRERTTFLITWDDQSTVKVEYRHFPFEQLHAPHPVTPFYVDSIPDLLANKLYALIERRYELDRIDIYLMLRLLPEVTVQEAVAAAEQKFDLRGLVLKSVLDRLGSMLPEQSPEALFTPLDLGEMATFFSDRGSPHAPVPSKKG
ncbi:MAG: nucleotidyl transferase AbiEii/AbiGii toxin family protein [Myxococcota bacterium]|nr:nucleotidyl transferase AbiEii/AbiGii toxin family protein [Myxococcota bacterium]